MKLFCYLNSTVPYTVDKYSASYKSYLPFLIDYSIRPFEKWQGEGPLLEQFGDFVPDTRCNAYILLGISLKV